MDLPSLNRSQEDLSRGQNIPILAKLNTPNKSKRIRLVELYSSLDVVRYGMLALLMSKGITMLNFRVSRSDLYYR